MAISCEFEKATDDGEVGRFYWGSDEPIPSNELENVAVTEVTALFPSCRISTAFGEDEDGNPSIRVTVYEPESDLERKARVLAMIGEQPQGKPPKSIRDHNGGFVSAVLSGAGALVGAR